MKKLLVIFAAIALIVPIFAQDSAIRGTAVLEDGSAIPGVAVTLEGTRIAKKVAVTSTEGNFRFIKLWPGTYKITATLEGFKTYEQSGIIVAAGQNITLQLSMSTGQLEETMQITGTTNVIDTRTTTIQKTLTEKMIQSLPTARNTWTLLNLIPGMMVDRPDVGGAESGQQSRFYGNGVASTDSQWNMDGADVTDMSALGAAPAYYDVNSLEELQVTTGSNDISARTGGTQINMISRSGGNAYSGSMHVYVEDKELEFAPNPPQEAEGISTPGINSLYQYGINFGGPILKDKLFFFGAYSIQDIKKRTESGLEDATFLKSGYFKLDLQLGNTTIFGKINLDDKSKFGRTGLGPSNQGPDTLWDQSGPGWSYSGSIQQVIGNLMVNAKVSFVNGGFDLDPRGSDINADGYEVGQDWYIQLSPLQYWFGSCQHYGCDRNQLNASLDGNYFMEEVIGGDHELRFGVDYLKSDTTTYQRFPNGHLLVGFSPWVGYDSLGFRTQRNESYNINRISFYIQDTATFGKLTANIGVRYDREWGGMNETDLLPHPEIDKLPASWAPFMGPAKQKPTDGATWENISPRVSFTYDITGDGKNVLKLSAARYASAGGSGLSLIHTTGFMRSIYVPFQDLNENHQFDWGTDYVELLEWNDYLNKMQTDSLYMYWVGGFAGFDPDNFGESPNLLDENYSAPLTDELSLTFEKALGEDFSISLTGFWKRRHNLIRNLNIWTDNTIESNSDWGLVSTSPELGVDVYRANRSDGKGVYNTNFKNRYTQFTALQGIFAKRLSHGWMANASFTLSSWTWHLDKNELIGSTTIAGGDAQLMSQFDYWNSGVVAPQSGGSGIAGLFCNARWMFKLSGLVQLPLDINFTWTFDAREGYVINFYDEIHENVNLRDTSVSEKWGTDADHMPAYYQLNLGLEKDFKITDRVSATFFCDLFNALNKQVSTKQNRSPGNHDEILMILPPGLFQFGFRINF